MNWLNVIEIIVRLISGLIVIGFLLGLFLRDKFDFFENMLFWSMFIMLFMGMVNLFVFAIFGGD